VHTERPRRVRRRGDHTAITPAADDDGLAVHDRLDRLFAGASRLAKHPDDAAAVVADFLPIEGSRIGELAARWDIVLGVTPEDG
jgi:hypothetical protein